MQTASLSRPVLAASAELADRVNPAPAAAASSLAILDDPHEWSSFSRNDRQPAGCWESSVVFEGMHCAACAITIEDALRQVPGVISVDVSAASHRGRVVWSQAVTMPSQWMAAAGRAGYPALPANDAFISERRRMESRLALWRLGVAGLCMMQVMMYAWPAYIAEPGDIAPDMAQLLRWASWVLSLPVLLFACAPFFSSAWRDLLARRVSMDLPVALGMAITFGVSTVGTFEPQGLFGAEVYFDSFTMFVFFLLAGRWLELRLRDRTAGALEALMNRLPDSVERRNAQGLFERVAVRRLASGDVVRVRPGEVFPADGDMLEGCTLADESLLTGESRPVARGQGDRVIAGSHNLSTTVTVRVVDVGKQTRFAQIVALMESASVAKPQLARLADRLARPFLVAVLVAAALALLWWWPRNPEHALMVAVAVLIVTCPCALSLATPAAMLASAGSLARRGVLVRRLQALETLATVDTVVFDKTGTLTRDAFVLDAIHTREGVSPETALAMAAALGRHSLHPVSRALCQAQEGSPSSSPWTGLGVAEAPGQGVSGELRNESSGSLVTEARLGSASYCQVERRPSDRLQTHLSDHQGWLATFELREDVRPDAAQALAMLTAAGVHTQLLSGDQPRAVERIAREVGMTTYQGGCLPQDKLTTVQELVRKGRRVAMVGDGLNDGPALALAHVSFAFGQSVPLAQAKCDFIVLSDQLVAVARSLLQARRTLTIVKQNLWWAALYNAVCVPMAVAGWLPAWLAGLGMALSSLLVVLNALRLSTTNELKLAV